MHAVISVLDYFPDMMHELSEGFRNKFGVHIGCPSTYLCTGEHGVSSVAAQWILCFKHLGLYAFLVFLPLQAVPSRRSSFYVFTLSFVDGRGRSVNAYSNATYSSADPRLTDPHSFSKQPLLCST